MNNDQYLDKLLSMDMARMRSYLEKDPTPFQVHLTDEKSELPPQWTTTELHECVAEAIKLSYSANQEDKNKAFVICALVWEFFHDTLDINKNDLASYLSSVFIRLGVPISAKTLTGIEKEFEPPNSILDQIELGEKLSQHHRVTLGENSVYYLSDFQKKVWDTSLQDHKVTSISSSTSGGKSFIINLKIIDELLTSLNTGAPFYCFYVVPTVSLMNQVTHDFSDNIKRNVLLMEQWTGHNLSLRNNMSHLTDNANIEKYSICVVTQERIEAFSWEAWSFSDHTIIVFDECHNAFPKISQILTIDEIGEDEEKENNSSSYMLDERSERYREVVEKSIEQGVRSIFSAPDIDKLPNFLKKIFSFKNVNPISDNQMPVLKLVYSLNFSSNRKGQYRLTQKVKYQSLSKKSTETISINKLGENNYMKGQDIPLIAKIINASSWPTIVVDRTPKNAQKITQQLSEKIELSIQENSERSLLEEYIRNNIYNDPEHFHLYFNKGLISHHGKLPKSLRLCLEIGIKENLFPYIICTTTLLQGINFPVKLLICKDDKTASTRQHKKITLSKNDFSNMVGRSGRLTKDLVGYVLILNEEALEEDKQEDNTSDEIIDDIIKDRDQAETIIQILSEQKSVVNSIPNNDVVQTLIFIRQRIFILTKKQARSRLAKRLQKMELTFDEIYKKVKEGLKNVSQNKDFDKLKELSRRNPSFDPYDLEKIYNQNYNLPPIQLEENKNNNIDVKTLALNILNLMYDDFRWYLRKERIPIVKPKSGQEPTPEIERQLFEPLSIILGNWARGISYLTMLKMYIKYETGRENTSKDYIDFQGYLDICIYNLSKLIKPWVDSYNLRMNKELNIMTQIEYGGYQPVFLSMLQYGLDREMALKLSSKTGDAWDEKFSFQKFLNLIKQEKKSLDIWEIKQIEYLFPIDLLVN